MDRAELQVSRLATWRWDATWMGMRCKYQDLGGGETRCGWRRDAIRNWTEVSRDMDGGETPIQRPGWGWDGTWLELRCNRMGLRGDLDGYEMLIMGPGWRWDVIWVESRTWMDVWCTWAIDITWMDARCKYLGLDWYEMWPGCRWGRDRT